MHKTIEQCFASTPLLMMEGALGERLKREYGLAFDQDIAMAGLVHQEAGRTALKELWQQYAKIAKVNGLPFLATTPTRRGNRERMALAGEGEELLAENVRFLKEVRTECGGEIFIGGLMGCKGDAYTGEGALSASEARAFHRWQAEALQKAGVDFLYAGIMPVLEEAVGMAQTMSDTGLPYVISFTIQRDGCLVDQSRICDAIEKIDGSVDRKPLCYMTNCVHPLIVYEALSQPFNQVDIVRRRFLGIQANTSPLSYAELDGASDLKCAEPEEFAEDMWKLVREMGFKIVGGCCGTDWRHMRALALRVRE